MDIIEDFKARGIIDSVTDEELFNKLRNEQITFYIGTDPTGDSLHVGHYSSFLIAKRLKDYGHNPILLVGGATGLIGDPKPNSERPMITKEELDHNYNSLKKQVDEIFGFETVNNYDWSKDINFIDYLRDYGKYFPLSYMLSKDTVKRRMDIGITYTEFSYMILQSLDFLHLFENKNCLLQVGGSDQWGNITAGVELIRRKTGKTAYGLTAPLITKADGTKFGKTESGTVWLDKSRTSPYELYQFFINTDDSKVIDYLYKLTLISIDEIKEMEKEHLEKPELRTGAKRLASEVVSFIHGSDELENAIKISESLFNTNIKNLKKSDIVNSLKGVPSFEFNEGVNIIDFLVDGNVCSSKREAREFVSNGAISINGDKVTDPQFLLNDEELIEGSLVLVRKGKKKYFIASKK